MVVSAFIMNRRCSYMQWHCRNRHLLYGTETHTCPFHVDSVYTIPSARTHKCFGRFVPNWYAFWAERESLGNKKAIPTNSTNNTIRMCMCVSLSHETSSAVNGTPNERTNEQNKNKSSRPRMAVYVCVSVCMWFIWFAVAVWCYGYLIKLFDRCRWL